MRHSRGLRGFQAAALAALLGLALGAGPAAASETVGGIRVGAHPDKTRVVLDASAALKPEIVLLDGPPRVVIDLPAVSVAKDAASGLTDPVKAKSGVKAVRHQDDADGLARVVVEVSGPVRILKSFGLPPNAEGNHRYVIDFAPTDEASFAKSLGGDRLAKAPEPAPPKPAPPSNEEGAGTLAALADAVQEPQIEPAPPVERPREKPASTAGDGEGDGSNTDAATIEQLIASLPTETPVEDVVIAKPPLAEDGEAADRREGRLRIAIDAGHGGRDPGALGSDDVHEKHVTLAMAKVLKKELLATGNYDVVMTREDDRFIQLRERVAIARNAEADLFLSLHANANEVRSVRGASVYTLSDEESDKQAAALANRENQADLIGGVDMSRERRDVSMVLIELAQRAAMNDSAQFARVLLNNLSETTLVMKQSHQFAGFVVLTAPDMPSVLVELGCMTNKADLKEMQTDRWRRRVAGSIREAIDNYFEVEPTTTEARLNN
ncbi:MAG: N-acetylmuramoyl-L-alanine amidase [Pseudomonadota bacterium]